MYVDQRKPSAGLEEPGEPRYQGPQSSAADPGNIIETGTMLTFRDWRKAGSQSRSSLSRSSMCSLVVDLLRRMIMPTGAGPSV